MSAILESYASDDRSHLDYVGISNSEEFRRYFSLFQSYKLPDKFSRQNEISSSSLRVPFTFKQKLDSPKHLSQLLESAPDPYFSALMCCLHYHNDPHCNTNIDFLYIFFHSSSIPTWFFNYKTLIHNCRYVNLAQDLHRVNIFELSADEKLAFFLNLHNAMVIHAVIRVGHPDGAIERRSFYSDFLYIVGGHTYSLNSIKNGILRGNKRAPYSLVKPFGAADKCAEVRTEEFVMACLIEDRGL